MSSCHATAELQILRYAQNDKELRILRYAQNDRGYGTTCRTVGYVIPSCSRYVSNRLGS